jgi:MYXO-CTERM domain-containing protein
MPTPKAPILGSAGGAANSTSAATAGGNGGGAIILEAADIQIDGSIEADGASPLAASGVARGGGSGGFIAILAAHLTGTGTISVRGGDGPVATGLAPAFKANHGGGGGGGVIFFHARDNASTITPDVAGGATGNCPAAASGKDGTAPSLASDPVFCVDADQDGYTSAACGGDDCNDSDPTVHPTAKEVCNGVDDNCVDGVDEGADICVAGSTCDTALKMCVGESDAGTDAGPVAGSPPKYVTFESGCSIGESDGPLGGLAVVGLGLTALVARRRRRSAASADR